ncbi:hypothetical protein EVAR_14204_1 [Eumeta japonica]|uniref:Reverse transcriptase domain-containing protein n=1 Tax=Eumeta variegata TaxID=151549 RepID=A0A4C1UEI9_EUMVA|nr:hypothetical protein EVAR_14204_1 [Eumeta japonica]
MTNSIPIDITINEQKLEYVEEYVNLGQIITPNYQMSKEIYKRIASGRKKYWALKEILKSKELGIKIEKRTSAIYILPCIVYSCETWVLTKRYRDELGRCQKSMERTMLGPYTANDRRWPVFGREARARGQKVPLQPPQGIDPRYPTQTSVPKGLSQPLSRQNLVVEEQPAPTLSTQRPKLLSTINQVICPTPERPEETVKYQ